MPNGKQNRTFSNAQPIDFNACVGTNGGPYNLSDYACGFYESAKRVIRSLNRSRGRLDVLVYPIACNFRHAVELSIKYVLERYPPLWDEGSKPKLNHHLRENWSTARPYLYRTGAFRDDDAPLRRVDGIVTDLAEIDPNGETFRYPTSKQGKHHLTGWGVINLRVLSEQIEFAEGFFDWCDYMADELWEARSDALAHWCP